MVQKAVCPMGSLNRKGHWEDQEVDLPNRLQSVPQRQPWRASSKSKEAGPRVRGCCSPGESLTAFQDEVQVGLNLCHRALYTCHPSSPSHLDGLPSNHTGSAPLSLRSTCG